MNTPLPIALFTRNWHLKLFSLLLGACLWYFVVGEDQVDVTITIPMEVHNLPSNLVIANKFKKDIDVSVRGPRRMIQDLREESIISRTVDLSHARPGALVITNDSDSIPFPRGIEVLRVQPTTITISVDELIEKNFPIFPLEKGRPAPGYVVESIELKPSHLKVSGPRTLLDKEQVLSTYIIDLENLQHSTTLQVHLNLSNDLVHLIGETVVTANITVSENIVERVIHGIPINVRDNQIPIHTVPKRVTVQASIPENLLRKNPEPVMLFRASVSAKDIKEEASAPVTVSGITVPSHAPIVISKVIPETVYLVPQEEEDQEKSQTDQEQDSSTEEKSQP